MKQVCEVSGNRVIATDKRLIVCVENPDVYIYAEKNTPGWTVKEYGLKAQVSTYELGFRKLALRGYMPISDRKLLNNIDGLKIGGDEQGSIDYAISLLRGTIQTPGCGKNPGNAPPFYLVDVRADVLEDHNLK